MEDIQITEKKCIIKNYNLDSMPECQKEWSGWCCFRSLLISLIWTALFYKVCYVDIISTQFPKLLNWFMSW
jgi:hypothetical protein